MKNFRFNGKIGRIAVVLLLLMNGGDFVTLLQSSAYGALLAKEGHSDLN